MKERILDTAHLEKIRRKKRMRKIRAAVILCLILVVILIWLTGIGSLYVARISDFMETVELRMRTGKGFPVPLVMGSETQGASMTAAVVMMDDSEVFVVSDTGSSLRNFQHGYARPGLSVGDTRFCIYNQGGKELRIEGRSRNYGTLNMAKPIQFVTMSADGDFAVVTQSDSYQAKMTIYNDAMDEVYSWYCAEEYPITAAFSKDGKKIAVGCLSSGGGRLFSVVYLVGKNSEEISLRRDGCLILAIGSRPNGDFIVVYDDAVITYDAETMEELALYPLSDSLLCCDVDAEDGVLIVQGDAGRDAGVALTVLSDDLAVLRSVTVGDAVRQCILRNRTAYLMGKNQVFSYTMDVEETQERPAGKDSVFDPEHKPLCLIDNRELLLLTAQQLTAAVPQQTEEGVN
ncbi:MAG: hypothetical protein IJ412_03880 [Oscillospiraceae bacterium]|nr:hypothetical protein [Oscillospiraceae bacterium]